MDAPSPIRLLYIDDDRGLSRLVEKELGRHGYAVTCAPDGDAGLHALAAGEYDICALDHYMPGRDGLDVLPDIMALPAPPPVVGLMPPVRTPHVELLCYRAPRPRLEPTSPPNAVAASRLVMEVPGLHGGTALTHDPDGHTLLLCPA